MSDAPLSPPGGSGRIASIDALRGLTILVMIFVNDIAGVPGTPAWMEHFRTINPDGSINWYADGMTFVDWVFPSFLFIVGMAIPFAIGRRMDQGVPLSKIWGHILVRTLGLLIIGFFMVNAHDANPLINRHLWNVLMYLCVILVWSVAPKDPGPKRTAYLVMKIIGALGLIALAALYRHESGIWMRTHWWGILGLIGWAYLVACIAYTLFRHSQMAMLGVAALLYCLFMADRVGTFEGLYLAPGFRVKEWIDIGSMLGSHAAITISGVVLGMILTQQSPVRGHWPRMRWALVYGAGLWIAGWLLYQLHGIHDMFIINKNAATVPWCLISSAYTVWIWVAIYWVMDVMQLKRWAIVIRPGGENPLFAYILHPMLVHLFALLALAGLTFWADLGSGFATGFWRSLFIAFAVVWLSGGLKRVGVWLRL
ncbi:DUF5009 domain-containing protein [Candidatus Sumerlaeota bacterium]|nr:DUF5009 domain-containing protein [Candidatus Sumerlaeota bacterium]